MKTLLAAAAAVSMLAVAAPASAQWRDNDRDGYSRDRDYGYNARDHRRWGVQIDRAQAQIEARLFSGLRSGRLSHREARRYQAGMDDIRRLEARYRRNGLQQWEFANLMRSLDRLDSMMTADLRDRNRYRG